MNLASGLDTPCRKRIIKVSQRFEVLAQFKQKTEVLSKNGHHDANTNLIEANLRVSRETVREKEAKASRGLSNLI
jgi:hypothetical protein